MLIVKYGNFLTESGAPTNLALGDRVIIKSSQGSKAGILRYMGTTDFAAGEWCGVELDDPLGKNDGSVSGTRFDNVTFTLIWSKIKFLQVSVLQIALFSGISSAVRNSVYSPLSTR